MHCFQGKSRSASVVIGYLMQQQQMSYLDAVDFVKAKRSVVAPNIGFALQLKKFERALRAEIAATNAATAATVDAEETLSEKKPAAELKEPVEEQTK